jgi:hypothetical protein
MGVNKTCLNKYKYELIIHPRNVKIAVSAAFTHTCAPCL